jgi:tetratricopeptide (TPR) repeat protein
MRFKLLAILLLLIGAPLRAGWHEAQSEHFVIYADDRAEDVKAFAEMLETYHSAMELITGRKVESVSPSSRLTIFAVGNERQMQKLAGGDPFIAGFYIPRAGFSRAFVPNIRINRNELDPSMQVLLHEYAHHFLISQTRFAMPRWMSEGAAEFYSSAQFPKSGNVSIGRPANHRAYELAYADDVSLRELLDHEVYSAKKRDTYDAFYGRSWLLYHYLFFNESRRSQMNLYAKHLLDGMPALKAAEAAFGNLDTLEKELNKYGKARRMTAFNLTPDLLPPVSPVSVRAVSAGHAAVLPLIIRSQRGVDREEAAKIVAEARKIALRHPNDAHVHAALAEAEYDAGDNARAIAAADRAIAFDPSVKNAYVQKGYALFRQAADAPDQAAAYKAAMVPWTQLNKLENDHPLPLLYYFRSYLARDMEPSDRARHALERAAQLAPFDQPLWFEAGLMQASEGKLELAIASLSPLAADPHGGDMARQAAALITAMKAAPEGQSFDSGPVLASLATAEAAAQPTSTK